MGFPLLPAISSAGKPSARLMVALAGAAPARTATMVPLKSPAAFPFAPLAARSSGRGRGDGETRGGGARLVGEGIYTNTALHRPASKKPTFPSFHVLCLPRGAGGDNDGDCGVRSGGEGAGGVGSGGDNNGAGGVGSGGKGAGGVGSGGKGAGGNNNGDGGNHRSWALMKQILLNQVVQALILFVVYKFAYNAIYNYIYCSIKNLVVSYMLDDEFNEMLYNYLFALFKKLGLSYLQDKEIKENVSQAIVDIASPWLHRAIMYCVAVGFTFGGFVLWRFFRRDKK